MGKYSIQDSEAGNVIDTFDTLREAEQALKEYEQDDKQNGVYTEGFYQISQK
jgi:hypothetical protein